MSPKVKRTKTCVIPFINLGIALTIRVVITNLRAVSVFCFLALILCIGLLKIDMSETQKHLASQPH